jgi:tRNA A64-2'-O-ribosylphosphate transferase
MMGLYRSKHAQIPIKRFLAALLWTPLVEARVGYPHDTLDAFLSFPGMPDALSKTIPIWCSVVNRQLFPDDKESHDLYTPPQVVSPSEHAQILALLPKFQQALEALNVPIEALRQNVAKPLRPVWLTPESETTPTTTVFKEFHPVVCCTVSRRVQGGEASEGGYIQGAGDDTENWAFGLTPTIFWANRQTLLSTSEGDLPELIETLVNHTASSKTESEFRLVKPTSTLFVSHIAGLGATSVSPALVIVLLPIVTEQSTWNTSPTRLDVGIGPYKIGSRNLRAALPVIVDFVKSYLKHVQSPERQLVVACESGKNASIGVALALLCLFFDAQGQLTSKQSEVRIDKAFIRGRLGWISTALPDANPNRATLQSVNSYLMDRPI